MQDSYERASFDADRKLRLGYPEYSFEQYHYFTNGYHRIAGDDGKHYLQCFVANHNYVSDPHSDVVRTLLNATNKSDYVWFITPETSDKERVQEIVQEVQNRGVPGVMIMHGSYDSEGDVKLRGKTWEIPKRKRK